MNNARVSRLLLWGLLLCLSLYILILFRSALVNDDYMALYTTWLLSTGNIAGSDFNVDSYTLLFDLLVPIYRLVGENFEVIFVFRFIFLLLLIIITFQIYHLLKFFFPRPIAHLTIIFLMTSAAMFMRGLDIRPDLIILIFWLQTIIVLYTQQYSERIKLLQVGFFLGLAILFKIKAIVICAIIGFYFLCKFLRNRSIKRLVIEGSILVFGAAVIFALFTLLLGQQSLETFINTTFNLISHSTLSNSNSLSLKFSVIKRFWLYDPFYWSLALAGILLAIYRIYKHSALHRHCLVTILLLAACSVISNPHYHAYNLVTLYPLMAIFVAFSLQQISLTMKNLSTNRVRFYTVCLITVLIFQFGRMANYPLKHDNLHQVELNKFIQNNTSRHEPIFTYEGIGLFRPSTFHWRTSSIKLDNYYSGVYNVWQEVKQAAPVLVIESYRIPGWLLKEDKQQLASHYTPIAPFVLTLGFATEATTQGQILRSGKYLITNSEQKKCYLNNAEIPSDSQFWLEAGTYTLGAVNGRCTLRWYYSPNAINLLKASNPQARPYLYRPS